MANTVGADTPGRSYDSALQFPSSRRRFPDFSRLTPAASALPLTKSTPFGTGPAVAVKYGRGV